MKFGKIEEQHPQKSVHLSEDCRWTAHQLLTDSSLHWQTINSSWTVGWQIKTNPVFFLKKTETETLSFYLLRSWLVWTLVLTGISKWWKFYHYLTAPGHFNNNKSTLGCLLADCLLFVIYQQTADRFFWELAVLQFYLKFNLVKYPGSDWKHPLVIFMLQAFVLLVIGLTTSVVVIWYSFVLPAILLYTTPWIVLHITTAHWLLINIVFHYFKAVFTSPGRAPQVWPHN